MDPLTIYAQARAAGLRPALLESLGPATPFSRLTILGLRPSRRLEVWAGVVYEDGVAIGGAERATRRARDRTGARARRSRLDRLSEL